MSEPGPSEHPPGLWPAPGDGVLARRANLIVLTSAESGDMVEALLDILEQLAAAGADGRQFADAVAGAVEANPAGLAGDGELSVLAFGAAAAGIAVTVCGTAWAQISTERGTARLEASQPGMLLRCLLTAPVSDVVGGLGLGNEAAARTDRFSRLDAGTVRASGLAYYVAGQPAGPSAPRVPPPVPVAQPVDPEPVTPLAEPAMPEPAIPEPAMPEPPAGWATPAVPADPMGQVATPMPTELWEVPAAQDPVQHEHTIAPVAEPFDAVMLIGPGPEPEEELGLAPRAPLPKANDLPAGTSSYVSAAPIIEGVYCTRGHFDDPQALFCAVCGIAMNQQTLVPRPGPRPPLGVLILDDGSVFQLDSDYVLGREPGLDASVASGQSRPLRIMDDSGVVSRVHAKIHLDGWRVSVTDLGSANGTRIKLPRDGGEQALAPHVPAVLGTGSQVDLGGREFRYESHRGR